MWSFQGWWPLKTCGSHRYGYGVAYLAKNKMATRKLRVIFNNPYSKAFLRSFFLEKSDLSRNRSHR